MRNSIVVSGKGSTQVLYIILRLREINLQKNLNKQREYSIYNLNNYGLGPTCGREIQALRSLRINVEYYFVDCYKLYACAITWKRPRKQETRTVKSRAPRHCGQNNNEQSCSAVLCRRQGTGQVSSGGSLSASQIQIKIYRTADYTICWEKTDSARICVLAQSPLGRERERKKQKRIQ